MEVDQTLTVVDPVEDDDEQQVPQQTTDQPSSIQESGKKLDAALANVEDKKSKLVGSKKGVPQAAPKGKKAPITTGKKGLSGKKKGLTGLLLTTGNATDGSKGHPGSKVAGEVISEEANEDEKPIDLLLGGLEAVEDPDVRVIEEFHRKTEGEALKWDKVLDITDILQKKDTANGYIMSCQVLGVVPVSSVVQALETHEIKLSHRGIGPKGAQALAESLEKNTTVQYLELANNAIMSGGFHLGTYLANNRFITYLDLSNNRLGRESGKALAEMIADNSILQILNLSGNEFTDKDADVLGSSLGRNMSIHTLDLSYNDIGDIGAVAIGAGLSVNESLKSLNLSWNKIRTKGFLAFFIAMKDNSTLVSLNLERNGFGEGVTSLNTFLSRNTSLTTLNLASNRIGDMMIQLIGKTLETNSTLTDLNVSKNPFTDKGAAAFLKSVLNNNTLEKLNLSGVRFTKESIAKIEELRTTKTSLAIVE